MDDVIGEILLRLPPGDPACLVRASLVCKLWRGLLSDRGFLRRYRAFHRTPPVLGFFQDNSHSSRFVPVTGAPPCIPHPEADWCPLDCRHGRVVLNNLGTPGGLVVWDPITGARHHLRQPMNEYDGMEYPYLTAAVLCAADGCDHLDCRGGPYLVVFAGAYYIHNGWELDEDGVVRVSVYSSETGSWSEEVSAHHGPAVLRSVLMETSLLAGDALYFMLDEGGQRILEYDLVRHVVSVIDGPPVYAGGNMVLMTAEDGRRGLGIGHVNEDDRMELWSWKNGIGDWELGRVIKLGMMISIVTGDPSGSLYPVGFAEGAGSIFVRAYDGMFIVELKPDRVRKVAKSGDLRTILPFTSFYTPDQFKIASANED